MEEGEWKYVSPKITSEEMNSAGRNTERRRRCSKECYVNVSDNEVCWSYVSIIICDWWATDLLGHCSWEKSRDWRHSKNASWCLTLWSSCDLQKTLLWGWLLLQDIKCLISESKFQMFRYRSLLFSDEKIKLERSTASKIHRNVYLNKFGE